MAKPRFLTFGCITSVLLFVCCTSKPAESDLASGTSYNLPELVWSKCRCVLDVGQQQCPWGYVLDADCEDKSSHEDCDRECDPWKVSSDRVPCVRPDNPPHSTCDVKGRPVECNCNDVELIAEAFLDLKCKPEDNRRDDCDWRCQIVKDAYLNMDHPRPTDPDLSGTIAAIREVCSNADDVFEQIVFDICRDGQVCNGPSGAF